MPVHVRTVYKSEFITNVGVRACISMSYLYQLCRHVLFCAFVCLRGKMSSVLKSISSSSLSASMPNMQQAWYVSVGLALVKLQWVRRSGKFGGAKTEQKEQNLASSLGSEKYLLALCQNVGLQRRSALKVISCSCWWVTCKQHCTRHMRKIILDTFPPCDQFKPRF